MSNRPQWGYYTKVKEDQQYTTYFELQTCETCGGECQSADGTPWIITPKGQWADKYQLNETFRIPLNVKFKLCKTQPAEQYYNEKTDLCICDNCA